MSARYVTDLLAGLRAGGDRPAVLGDGHTETFAELVAGGYRTARALRRVGLERGDGLVLLAANTPAVFRVRLAAHILGLRFTHVPLGRTAHAVPHILADAEPAAVVHQDDFPVDGAGVVLSLTELGRLADAEDGAELPVEAAEEDLAKITYTGGTTGLPKGVPTTFAALHAAMEAALRGAEASRRELMAHVTQARFLAVTPVAHVAGDIALMMLAMGVGVEVYDFEPAAVLRSLAALSGGAAFAYLYPALLYQLLDHPDLPGTDTSALKLVIYGSAPMAPSRLREAMDRFGPVFQQGYASTEAPAITALSVADHVAGLHDRPELLSSAGRPLPGVELALRDAEDKNVPVGDVGEVCVRARSTMSGYWHRPDETASVLRDGWLHTGDLGRLSEDGYLFLVGRAREMIIVGGWNTYAVPIEAVLTEHPAVRSAAVVGVPDDETGEAIVAFVVTDPAAAGAGLAAELRERVADRLGAVSVPKRLEFLDAMPLTPVGKADKTALRERLS